MQVRMKMPDLATNQGADLRVVRWLLEIGQAVKRGQALLEVETDKAIQEVECIANGTLETIHVPAGESAPVGAVVATIKIG
jgi:pyruvate/2-oxoglutarate dehydrogenase complex dihydrolipoamide acyltransferase (E2) component